MQTTAAGLEAIYYNFLALFQDAFDRLEPWSERIATTVPSSTRANRYPWMEQIPRMREWIGERAVRNLSSRLYILENKPFEETIGIDRDDIDDDNFGVYNQHVAMLAHQAKKWPDDLITAALQAGTSTTCFDGQYFFDTDHPTNMDDSGSAVYSNLYTSTALTAANYQIVRTEMMSRPAADGKPLRVMPNLLMVPPQLEAQGRQILNADMIAPSGAFGINASGGFQSNVLKGSAELLVVPDLAADPTVWYLMDTTKPVKPFLFQLRKAPQFVSLTSPTDPNVFHRKTYLYGVDSRGNAGYSLPFLAARCIA